MKNIIMNYINYISNINFAKYDQTKQAKLKRQLIDEMPTINIPNIVFRNKGDLEFDRYSKKSGLHPSYSNGAAYSDLDNDGDIDLVINNINQEASILENKSLKGDASNFISFRFMDWMYINHHTVSNWANRTKPNFHTQEHDQKGGSWELVIELCNYFDIDH